jgi:hypothetical protein
MHSNNRPDGSVNGLISFEHHNMYNARDPKNEPTDHSCRGLFRKGGRKQSSSTRCCLFFSFQHLMWGLSATFFFKYCVFCCGRSQQQTDGHTVTTTARGALLNFFPFFADINCFFFGREIAPDSTKVVWNSTIVYCFVFIVYGCDGFKTKKKQKKLSDAILKSNR